MQRIEWQKPILDAAIVVGGGSLLDQFASKVGMIDSLLGNLPIFMGISLRAIALGSVALIVVHTWLLKR